MSFVIAVVALVLVLTLRDRVSNLEREITELKRGSVAPPQHTNPYTPEQEVYVPDDGFAERLPAQGVQMASSVRDTALPIDTPPEHTFIDWVRKDFMVKLGAFLLLLALGWFVSYAFAEGWIGPAGRIALGLMLGAAFLGVGAWRIETYAHQGGIFAVLGSTIVMFTVLAAREMYGFFDPYSALLIMLLSIVFVAFMSVRYNRHSLALASLFMASIAPFFTNAPMLTITELSLYLLVIVCGTLWIVFVRSWSVLILMSLVIVFLQGLPYLMVTNGGDQDIALLFSFIFTAIFFIANIFGVISNKGETNNQAHITVGIGTGLYLILWIMGAAEPEWQSLLLSMWMLVFGIGSFVAYRLTSHRILFYIYAGTSIVLLGTATAIELQGQSLTVAYALEVAALTILALKFLPGTRTASVLAWLFIIPVMLALPSFDSYVWSQGLFHEHFFILVFMGALLGLMGAFLTPHEQYGENEIGTGKVLTVTAALFGLGLIWRVLHVPTLFSYEVGTMVSLIIYTVLGLWLYIMSKQTGVKAQKVGGLLLLGFVVARLLLIEVWNMELTGRIITFVIIGLLLMSTAFIRRNNQQ